MMVIDPVIYFIGVILIFIMGAVTGYATRAAGEKW
jgi:hypothetical protein